MDAIAFVNTIIVLACNVLMVPAIIFAIYLIRKG